ncbi:MAG: CheR family methyltransferase [Cyanobacteria bacterium P01_A01_bin.116]
MEHNDDRVQREIEELLRQKIGLNPQSVGARSIVRAVKRGMRVGKMQALSDYLAGLQSSDALFEALVESIVVPETSFFRNRASFVFLRQWISQEWSKITQKKSLKRPLRVLSIPCSTGEEPYSIAITLLEEALKPNEFQIDAVDISEQALEKAKQGVYSPYAFRRQTYREDDKYFTLGSPHSQNGKKASKRATQRYFLADSVRDCVSFHRGNVLDPQFFAEQAPYDIVFCRNLLIYLDRAARDRTFSLLNRLIRPGGLLFVGYAETNLVSPTDYSPVPYPQTFAYRHRISITEETTASGSLLAHSIANRLSGSSSSSVANGSPMTRGELLSSAALAVDTRPMANLRAGVAHSGAKEPASLSVTQCGPETLVLARDFADKGDLEEARRLCDRYLESRPAEAAAYLLRGELSQAIGDEAAAEECFERAVYLDAQLSEALTQLMLIKEGRQDFEGAAVIRARLQRLAKKI